jgi:ribulose-5-phosphate 4-epimerase/fuculose-1-phosphate aldolase
MQTEQELRVELAAMSRIFDYVGWSEMIYNHITVKIPGIDNQFLINPYGLHYSEVKASNLVKVDINGNVIDDTPYKANPAGMTIHSAIHEARPDAHCISHTHTTDGMAISCQEEGLRHDNFYSVLLYGQIAYHEFEGITVDPGEKKRLVSSLGNKNLLILKNHGLLVCGRNIPETFIQTWGLQRACEVQIATDSTSKPSIPVDDSIGEKSAQLLKLQMGSMQPGVLEFNAFVRKIDAIDPSYKD